jgi:putative endonuclease
MSQWSVYLIRTDSGALYTGIATDVDRRIREHGTRRGAKYLRGRGSLALVYRRRIGDRALASRVEHAVKRLRKAKKEAIAAVGPSRDRLLRTLMIDHRADA